MQKKWIGYLGGMLCACQIFWGNGNVAAAEVAPPNLQTIIVDNMKTKEYDGYIWRIDAKDTSTLPRTFRTSNSDFKENKGKYGLDSTYIPTREGLDTLYASGSAQFSKNQFPILVKTLKEQAKGPIYIVDLRQENHGFFNNDAVSWYGKRDWGNIGKTHKEVVNLEPKLLAKAKDTNTERATLDDNKNADAKDTSYISSVETEKSLVESADLHYVRITATDHIWPSPENIDDFIKLYRKLPKDAWLHFHCEAGKGRTTTYLAMYDMMKNPQVSLKDILYRQLLLGGNYVAYTGEGSNSWKVPFYQQKADMIKVFYQYVQENHQSNYKVLWSKWLEQYNQNK